MQLLVVRHAIAEDKEAFAATGRDDALRPLTADGARKMRRVARGLKELVPSIDILASSPLTRANETAEILRREYEIAEIEMAKALEPQNAPTDVVGWLGRYDRGVVAIVGHEPQLGRLVTHLIAKVERSGVDVKKGGVCLIEFDGRPTAGEGVLAWAIPPGIFRDLAG